MKRNNIIIVIITLLALVSCRKDFLDIDPYNRKVIGNFYKTPQDALEALVAAYDPLQYGYYDHIILMSEIASDNCYGGVGTSDDLRLQVWDDFLDYEFRDPHFETWERYYIGVYRANIFLQNVDEIEWGGNESLKNRYTAEARFLRAYYYFDLVRLFGNIPLLTEVLDVENLNVPQADPDDVYTVIAEDLKYAAENLPDIPYDQIPATEYGRITKWAAEALLVRVYLYYTGYIGQNDLVGLVTKTDARNYIDDIYINSGHALVDTFSRLYHYRYDRFVGEDNIETVFAIKYTYKDYGDQALFDGNRWQVMIGLRNQIIPPYANGWGACTVNPQLWNEWPSDDPRREASIIGWDELGIDFDEADQRDYTGYNTRKFVPLTTSPDSTDLIVTSLGGNYQTDNYFDYPVIRYADVLLMGAELYLDGDIGKAQTYFNLVRDRAYNDEAHRITLANDPASLEIIFEERRFELAFEGHRYWDLLRRGLDYAKSKIDCTDPYEITFRKETEGLFSIPHTQIELSNDVMKQNPGWE